ncbi:hypothetical protein RAS1_40100 [Phycisphaerae bacterium RAS1]|nr:hypothetical protein RAS1_40100 [Phycisphaerae bacterium RAS1]
MARHVAIAVALLCAAHVASNRTLAAAITLSGDLGSVNFNTPFFLNANQSSTTPFQHIVPGRGSISGDAIANNFGGNQFDLVITNLTFTGMNSPSGGTSITLTALQHYATQQSGNTYAAAHFVSGSWTTATGNHIICDSLHDFGGSSTSLPTLSFFNTPGIPTFGVPLAGTNVLNQLPTIYSIRTTIQLFLDGDGTISLPSSYDVSATPVPEPAGALVLLPALVAVFRRR